MSTQQNQEKKDQPKKKTIDEKVQKARENYESLVAFKERQQAKVKEQVKLDGYSRRAVKEYSEKKTSKIDRLKSVCVTFGTKDVAKINSSACFSLAQKLMAKGLELAKLESDAKATQVSTTADAEATG